jgi:hypothetical protein
MADLHGTANVSLAELTGTDLDGFLDSRPNVPSPATATGRLDSTTRLSTTLQMASR